MIIIDYDMFCNEVIDMLIYKFKICCYVEYILYLKNVILECEMEFMIVIGMNVVILYVKFDVVK